jgi:hypothetical protein
MNKDIIICFRTDATIKNGLNNMAEQKRISVSSVIQNAISNYLKENKALQSIEQDRRQYSRKRVSLPGFIIDENSEENIYNTSNILDISLSGIRLSIPKGVKINISTDDENSEFHVVFTLPEATHSLDMTCKPHHIFERETNTYIGAAFVNSDFRSYQTLQKFMI